MVFSSIDALIVPSLWNDTFPGVVFEAFGYGVPVIGSRRGGIPEMIVHGENGLLFDPDDGQGLVAALRSAMDPALRARLAAGAARSAARYADPGVMIDAYEDVLRQLQAQARAAPGEGGA
jgi:glycosyltransferase involved in cell wall biosynthesis